ncbi:hypothetical protein B4096_2582 [Heyndrickxia coagulans]|nr:hypothetical protein B4096_2582 [Heyndrickxia coagulans]
MIFTVFEGKITTGCTACNRAGGERLPSKRGILKLISKAKVV